MSEGVELILLGLVGFLVGFVPGMLVVMRKRGRDE